MTIDTRSYVTPRAALYRVFAARAATAPAAWRARTWAWAALLAPGAGDAGIAARLGSEWDAYRSAHPGEPDITFTAPPPVPDEPVVPGPVPVETFAPLRHGRYGVDLPTHEDRVRDEQERLARRDATFYGF
jgi:hypothetical protein